MTPIEIMEKIGTCQRGLTKGNIELKALGVKKARAEHDYRVALRKEILRLRQLENQPATIINDLAKGKEDIAKLRLERDIAETNYSVYIESMRNLRLEIEAYRSFLTWERVELKNT
ncbi:TPA: hypothetical protein PTW06_002417 [Clostridium botulinum]|uniref:hypothetical protein n=1 Tax=Clostridium botulinum TaxID=1491 RepID=UPI0029B1E155|nr:hypothetical protein [Clostridium botulinum]HDK7178350.1 hypothetical protein [Clostridium botulinum]HDK7190171.1 hypothetical protein [Clostridium botulinum]HDK7216989.1 hypothetical protein [Clostridium botulinum]HDK7224483.1 hypothetical protein [Clostridium botulinum]